MRGLVVALVAAATVLAAAPVPVPVPVPLSSPVIVVAATAPVTVPLSSSPDVSWTVMNASLLNLPATVPGTVHADLYADGVIGDPNFGANELLQRWIASDNFTYTATFPPAAAAAAGKRNVDLVLPGVDTAATVTLNGQPLYPLSSQSALLANMHRTWRLPAAGVLLRKSGGATSSSSNNTLALSFTGPVPFSALAESACGSASDPTTYCPAPWAGPAPSPIVNNAYVRKEQESFSWDFAPATGTTGVWKAPFLVAYNVAVLAGTVVDTRPAVDGAWGGAWNLTVSVRLYSSDPPPGATANVTVTLGGVSATAFVPSLAPGFTVAGPLTLTVPGPLQLWWPNGYGAQALYNATLTLSATGGGGDTDEVTTAPLSVGFRTFVLDQPPVPNSTLGGHLFRFVVNGLPILARGSNWVPAASLQSSVTPSSLAWLVSSFRASGYNTLRVWGGGLYVDDTLAALFDEAGILLYHDAVFGDQFYETGASFLANVAAEVADNAWRLGSHPSLALWCGNNEMASGYDEHDLYSVAREYSALYFDTVLANISAADPWRPQVSSTPSWGNETAAAPFHPNESSVLRGDTHFYDMDADCWNISLYPRARFVTEHGWESWPSFLTVAPTLTGPWDYSFNATLPFSRNHHPPGQEEMTFQVTQNYVWPTAETGAGGLGRYTRVRGRAAELAADHRGRSRLGGSGRGGGGGGGGGSSGGSGSGSGSGSTGSGSTPTWPADPLSPIPVDALAQASVLPANATLYRDELYLTQVTQAQCHKVGGEVWRRASDEYEGDTVFGGTAGILLWQANDVWPAPSWAMVESTGRPKAAFYALAHLFEDVLVSGWADVGPGTGGSGDVVVYVSNSAYNGGFAENATTVCVGVQTWADGAAADHERTTSCWPVPALAPHASTRVLATPLNPLLAAANCSGGGGGGGSAACFLTFVLYDGASGGGNVLSANWAFLAPFSSVTTMRDPELAVTDVVQTPGEEGVFTVTVQAAAAPAAFVWLETAFVGRFSQNAFLLACGVPRGATPCGGGGPVSLDLTWTSAGGGGANVTAAELAASLVVWSLWDTAPGAYGGVGK
jgi:uncharacterized membrane protein YgcG